MFRPFSFIALALLLAGLGACTKSEPPPTSVFETHWKTETQFIVESTVTDLAGMAYYAQHGRSVDAGQLQVEAREIPGSGGQPAAYLVKIRAPAELQSETKLPVAGSIWDPKMYCGVATLLFDKLGLDVTTRSPDDSGHQSLRELTGATAGVIERENGTISSALGADFFSPCRHEQAALLLAAFTLREHSGKFFEIRSELCRITAHLAFAQALRRGAPATPEGQLASAALFAFFGDQRSALRQLDGLPVGDLSVEAWVRALRIWITGDYRLLAGVNDPTLLERREEFVAKAASIDVSTANRALAETDELRESTDWARILNVRNAGVELGHEIVRRSVGSEINEARQVYLLATGEDLTEVAYVEKLNIEPEPCVSGRAAGPAAVRVIGWGHWAAFLQRHLCHAVQSDFAFLQWKWGVPEEARKYRETVDKQFGRLRLYPFVRRQNATEEAYYRQAQDAEMAVIRHSPHLVPVEVWNEMCDRVPFAAVYCPPPDPQVNEWHRFNPPPGTAYDVDPRNRHPSMTNRPDYPALLARLHEMAPYDVAVTNHYLWQRGRHDGQTKPSGAAMEKAYGPVLEFNSMEIAAVAEAYRTEPERYEHWMSRAAGIAPVWNYWLGKFYAEAGRDADTARAYERIIFSDTDAVRMSNKCDWLVKYYERHGQPEKATSLATDAAEVYSGSGLCTMADLLEMRGDFAGAIEFQRKMYERYDNPNYLVGCLLRYQRATGKTADDPALRQVVAKVLPKGLEKIEDEKLRGPPMTGVIIKQESPESRKAGLEPTDVIVGIRGYKVGNFEAYKAVCDMDPQTPFVLNVWRDGRYCQIKAAPPNNRFGVEMGDYVAE